MNKKQSKPIPGWAITGLDRVDKYLTIVTNVALLVLAAWVLINLYLIW